MSNIDINKLIYENITRKLKPSEDSISLNEAYFDSVVDQISKSDNLTIDDLKVHLPEIFENEEMVNKLSNKLTSINVFIEGFNSQTDNNSKSNVFESSILGSIASGLSVKKYLMSETKS